MSEQLPRLRLARRFNFAQKSTLHSFMLLVMLFCGPGFVGSEEIVSTDDLVHVARIAVGGALLFWGVAAPHAPNSVDPISIPAGAPTGYREGLSLTGTTIALIEMLTYAGSTVFLSSAEPLEGLSRVSTVVGAGYAVRSYVKMAFERPRPSAESAGAEPDRDSFPSGHALLAWSFVGDAAVQLLRAEAQPWVLPVLVAQAATISVLRVASGDHYAGDVLCGALIGFVAGAAVSSLRIYR